MFSSKQPSTRRLLLAPVLAAIICVAATGTTLASSTPDRRAAPAELKAFSRPETAEDVLPRSVRVLLPRRFGALDASRRIATASGFRGSAALYVVRLTRTYRCLVRIDDGGAGVRCRPFRQFFSAKRRVAAGTGDGFFYGVAANEIARVAFVDRHWRLHPVPLTRDGGFLYVCRNRSGCVAVIKAVNGYDRDGLLVSHERW